MKKRVFSLFLCLCLLLSLLPVGASAEGALPLNLGAISPAASSGGEGWSYDAQTRVLAVDGIVSLTGACDSSIAIRIGASGGILTAAEPVANNVSCAGNLGDGIYTGTVTLEGSGAVFGGVYKNYVNGAGLDTVQVDGGVFTAISDNFAYVVTGIDYTLAVSAQPQDGYVFTGWSGEGAVFADAGAANTTVAFSAASLKFTAGSAPGSYEFDAPADASANGVTASMTFRQSSPQPYLSVLTAVVTLSGTPAESGLLTLGTRFSDAEFGFRSFVAAAGQPFSETVEIPFTFFNNSGVFTPEMTLKTGVIPVTLDGAPFAGLNDAMRAAVAADASTVHTLKLFDDVGLQEDFPFSAGNLDFDLNGHTASGSIFQSGGVLTIRDTAGGGVLNGVYRPAFTVAGGALTVESGAFRSEYTDAAVVSGAAPVLRGGTFSTTAANAVSLRAVGSAPVTAGSGLILQNGYNTAAGLQPADDTTALFGTNGAIVYPAPPVYSGACSFRPVTVALRSVDYEAAYPYNGAPIPAPAAANFSSTSPAPITFRWKDSAGAALSGPPKDIGHYALVAEQAAQAPYPAASVEIPIVIRDTIPPVFGEFSCEGGGVWQDVVLARGDLTITISVADANSGVAFVLADCGGSKLDVVSAGNGKFRLTVPAALLSADADTPVELSATDRDGSIAHTTVDVRLDSAAPELAVQPQDDGGEQWYTGGYSISASDNLAVDSIVLQPDGGDPTDLYRRSPGGGGVARIILPLEDLPDGERNYTAVVTDIAGNKSSSRFSVRLDRTAPVVSGVTVSALTPTAALLTPAVTDNLSGLGSISVTVNGKNRPSQPGSAFQATGLTPGAENTVVLTCTSAAGLAAAPYTVTVTAPAFPSAALRRGSGSGISLVWDAVEGAERYVVERADRADGVYAPVAETAGTGWRDRAAETGRTWFYRVAARFSVDGDSYAGPYSGVISAAALAAPSVQAWSVDGSTMRLRWTAVEGALGYDVFRQNADGTYTFLKTTAELRCLDAGRPAGTVARYAVCAYWKDGAVRRQSVGGAAAAVVLAAPTLRSVRSNDGLLLRWDAVEGTDRFNVYRAERADGPYVYMASVVGTAWRDRTAESGKTYFYKLRPYLRQDGKIWYGQPSGVLGGSTMAAPAVSAEVLPDGASVRLSWSAVPGAAGYDVFRYNAVGSYTWLKTTRDLSFTDPELAPDAASHYLVCAWRRNGGVRENGYYAEVKAVLPS